MSATPPLFDDLVATDDPARARLLAAHELLIAAGPQPELPPDSPTPPQRPTARSSRSRAAASPRSEPSRSRRSCCSGSATRSAAATARARRCRRSPMTGAERCRGDDRPAGSGRGGQLADDLQRLGTAGVAEGEHVHALADEGRQARRVVRVVRRRGRNDRGAAERAVPVEEVRRLGGREDRNDAAAPHRRLSLPGQLEARRHLRAARYRRDVTLPTPDRPVRTQYEDFARLVLDDREAEARPHGNGHGSIFGHQMRFDLARASRWSRPRRCTSRRSPTSCCGFCAATSNVRWLQEHGVRSGTSGPTRTAISGPSTAFSGAAGRRPTAATSTRSPRPSRLLRDDPTHGGSSSAPGMSPTCRGWRCQPCHALFQFHVGDRTRPGARTAQLPALPAQRRRLPRRPVQHRELRAADPHARAAVRTSSRATSSGRAATATSTTTTASRSRRSSRAIPSPTRPSGSAAARRSSTTRSRTSRWSATSTTRRSAHRWRCEGHARRRDRARRGDRGRHLDPLAHPGGPARSSATSRWATRS